MRKIFTIIIAVLLTASVFAQSPEKMSYQAVIRDASDNLITDTQVGMQISILQGSANGTAVYVETQEPNTNANGLVNIEIGTGTTSDDFSTIDWANGPYFIKTETDPEGGTNYTITGTSQLLSVPYALHAKTAVNVTGNITESQISDLGDYLETETDPSVPSGTQTGEIQFWDGSEWVTLPPGSEGQVLTFVDGVPAWETPSDNDNSFNDVENPITGKIWMDRNLGASRVATSSTDADAYGDVYQWGRGTDGHQLRTSATTTTLSEGDTPGHGDFITNSVSPWDWRMTQNDNLWQGVDGINNPCPEGYRLPTEAELDAERQSWSSNDAEGAFASPLKFTVGGVRNFGSGTFYFVDEYGRYWTSTVNDDSARSMVFTDGNAYLLNNGRADGSSVRCIKD
ncbi:MAG: hypothetical protein ACOCYO_04120 [Bacteroidota bacterium]